MMVSAMHERLPFDNIENVILVTVDCLRPDFLKFYGYHRETMPNISKQVGGGIIIREAYTNAPFTLASIPSLMTSSYPLEGDPFYSLHGRPKPIYRLLREKGFKTAGFNSNDLLALIPEYREGFDYYWTPRSIENSQKAGEASEFIAKGLSYIYGTLRGDKLFRVMNILGKSSIVRRVINEILRAAIPYPYPSASIITTKAAEWIERNRDEPFFLWIHYMDTHNPYLVDEDLLDLGNPLYSLIEQELIKKSKKYYKCKKISIDHTLREVKSFILRSYEKRIQRVDKNIGKLIKKINEIGLKNETTLILTSDHGQGFLEHGFYSHLAYFYNEVLKIPLIIATLGEDELIFKEGPFSLIDVAPTTLSILGERGQIEYRGVDITESDGKNRIFSELVHGTDGEHIYPFKDEDEGLMVSFSVIRDGRWKYIAQYDKGGLVREELYDLAFDPKEERNLLENPIFTDILARIRKDHQSHLKEVNFDIKRLYYKYRLLRIRRKLRKTQH